MRKPPSNPTTPAVEPEISQQDGAWVIGRDGADDSRVELPVGPGARKGLLRDDLSRFELWSEEPPAKEAPGWVLPGEAIVADDLSGMDWGDEPSCEEVFACEDDAPSYDAPLPALSTHQLSEETWDPPSVETLFEPSIEEVDAPELEPAEEPPASDALAPHAVWALDPTLLDPPDPVHLDPSHWPDDPAEVVAEPTAEEPLVEVVDEDSLSLDAEVIDDDFDEHPLWEVEEIILNGAPPVRRGLSEEAALVPEDEPPIELSTPERSLRDFVLRRRATGGPV